MYIKFYFPRIVSAICLSSILFFACKDKVVQEAAVTVKVCISDSMQKIISIDSAVSSTVDDELKLSGEISFNDNRVIKVYPFSSGKVIALKVTLGDRVTKGQTLAIIKSADVAGNYSDFSSSGSDVAIAKRQMENTASLFQSGIASERELSEAKQNYQKAVNSAAKLQSQININGGGHTTADGNYVITAPTSGYVLEKKINEGAFIRGDNTDNMFTIGDISEVWVMANVYESDIAKVKEGSKVNVTTLAYPGKVFIGTVDKVSQILDPDTKVMKIRIKLANLDQKLKPQMFANVTVKSEEGQPVVTIPSTAYISDYGRDYVVVYHDKCKLEVRSISILKTIGSKTYLSAGLDPGEKIISKNQILLFKALTDARNQ